MEQTFSKEEKKNYYLKKYLKEHLFGFVLDIIGNLLCTILLLYLCNVENYMYGIILSFAYSLGKIIYNLHHYKKDYIDIDVK